AALRVAVPAWLEDASNGLTVRLRALLSGLYADLRALDERVRELDKEIRAIGRENEAVGRMQQLRGIGPLIASALVAMIGDARQFKNGRQRMAVASEAGERLRRRYLPLTNLFSGDRQRSGPQSGSTRLPLLRCAV